MLRESAKATNRYLKGVHEGALGGAPSNFQKVGGPTFINPGAPLGGPPSNFSKTSFTTRNPIEPAQHPNEPGRNPTEPANEMWNESGVSGFWAFEKLTGLNVSFKYLL